MPWPAPSRLLPGAPAGALCGRLDHGAGARVLEMAQAEGERVLAALGRQLVHERLDGEHVGECAERAQRRGADRHGEQAMVGDPPRREVVERRGVALRAAAAGQRRVDRDRARERLGELGGGEQRRRLGRGRAARRGRCPTRRGARRRSRRARRDRPRCRPPARRRTAPRPARPRATIAGCTGRPSAARASSAASRPRRRRRSGRSSRRPRRAPRRCSRAAARRPAPGRRADCRRPGCASTRAGPAPDHCAMAQDGAIEAWATKGREYSRRTVRAFRRGDGRIARVDRRGLDRLALDPGAQVALVGQRLARLPRSRRGRAAPAPPAPPPRSRRRRRRSCRRAPRRRRPAWPWLPHHRAPSASRPATAASARARAACRAARGRG